MQTARVRLRRRPHPYSDRLRAYAVLIDDHHVGHIRHGEEKTFDVEPGRRKVQLRIDWAKSEPRIVEARPGEIVDLECRPRNPLGALYWITFGRHRYIRLEEAESAGPSTQIAR